MIPEHTTPQYLLHARKHNTKLRRYNNWHLRNAELDVVKHECICYKHRLSHSLLDSISTKR